MDGQSRPVPGPVASLLVGSYSWLVIALLGAVLLDSVYARAIRGVLDPAEATTIFSVASDSLLLLVALTVVAAIGTIGRSWRSSLARNLFIASALLAIAEPIAPVVLRPLLLGSNAGLWVRLLLSASASVLGLLGLIKFCLRSSREA
jgi:hypothetical protein